MYDKPLAIPDHDPLTVAPPVPIKLVLSWRVNGSIVAIGPLII